MFEFEQYDRAGIGLPAHPKLDAETQRRFGSERIRSYSLMSWGEHCTECAFPSCYQTCSFYQPRQDGRCRRFNFGIYPAATPRSWMGYSAYIEFKNWSQLWTQGNATQLPGVLNGLLEWIGRVSWAISAPLDALFVRLIGRKRLSLVLQSLRRRTIRLTARFYRRFPRPEHLLIEVFNPMDFEARLHLRVRGDSKPARFEWTERVGSGFSSFAIPVLEMEQRIDFSRPFEMTLSVAEEEGKRLYFCSATFVRYARRPVERPELHVPGTKRIKCVVWDLDNTLWDGVLVEGQPSEFQLRDGIRSVLSELDRRGILLSVASKNSEEDAKQVLKSLGIWELFLVPQINWQPKSASLRRIAEQLNIGLDSIAFVDDMQFERDEVGNSLPMVNIVNAEQALSMLGKPEYAGDTDGGGSSRRKMYQTELRRQQDMAVDGLEYDEFLAGCQIRIAVQRPDDELLPRIYDIVQRTNQLNIATQRYELAELGVLVHNSAYDCYIVSCADKYGDYGHVGFINIALEQEGILIQDCMFSCRVQGKRIDEAVLAHLINHYVRSGVSRVRARFNQTKRNAPAAEMLSNIGFSPDPGREGILEIRPLSLRSEVPFIEIEGALETVR